VSNFIEVAIDRALAETKLSPRGGAVLSLEDVVDQTWDIDESDRFLRLAFTHPQLLTPEEQKIFKVWFAHRYFWRHGSQAMVVLAAQGKVKGTDFTTLAFETILWDRVRENWELLKRIARGEASSEDLPTVSEKDLKRPETPDGGSHTP